MEISFYSVCLGRGGDCTIVTLDLIIFSALVQHDFCGKKVFRCMGNNKEHIDKYTKFHFQKNSNFPCLLSYLHDCHLVFFFFLYCNHKHCLIYPRKISFKLRFLIVPLASYLRKEGRRQDKWGSEGEKKKNSINSRKEN